MAAKPRRVSAVVPAGDDRFERHTDPLAQIMYDRVGAEMRGYAESLNTYMETLLAGPFTRKEAFDLAADCAAHYWEAQSEAAHGKRRRG